MPRPSGPPITVTNGQPQREVERFHVFVTYDAAMVPHFTFQAHGVVRLRDGAGGIVWQSDNIKPLVSLNDSQIPAGARADFVAIVNKLDQMADPT